MNRALASAALVLGCACVAGPARAADPLRPDTLQTLGVGARSIGLGGAYVAVADDVTATFLNPAGLTRLREMQLALDFRTLPKASLDLRNNPFRSDIGSTSPQFSFVGLSMPLGQGSLGFSRTLGGYEQTHTEQTAGADTLLGDEIARYWFNTLAYGRSVPRVAGAGDLKVGIAAHWVQLNTLVAGGIKGGQQSSLQDGGNGASFSVGALFTPVGAQRLTLGFNYLNPTSIGGLDDASPTFGDRVPGRVSGGFSYLFTSNDPEKEAKKRILGSFEVRHYFGAANGNNVAEGRDSATDFHVGAEYRTALSADNWLYFRGGYFTRNSPNESIFFDDHVATLGLGYERKNRFSADVAVEISTETGDPLVTTSLRYNVSRLFRGH